MKKRVKIVLIVLGAVGIVIGGVGFMVYQSVKSMGAGSNPVADYDQRVNIWKTVAGNSTRSKLDEMNIDFSQNNMALASLAFAKAIVNEAYADEESTIDTFTYLKEIKSGYEKETYEDEPYLIPYVVEGSDEAVIVVPGGGFGFKSMDGGTSEGKDIAKTLNENGISAFVLHYRSNPYEYPVPYLDLQRAVRYLRHHAEAYHLDPDKISLIGFSAGGNEIGTFINLVQGKDMFPDDYVPDEIDRVDDAVFSAAMIYPALSFRHNVPMLFCMFDEETVRDETKREALLEQTDLYRHIHSQNVKQFIAYGTKDSMVGMEETKKYIHAAEDAGCDVTAVEVKGQDHGMHQTFYMDDYLKWLETVWEH